MGVLDDLFGALNPIDVDGPMGGRRGRKVYNRWKKSYKQVFDFDVRRPAPRVTTPVALKIRGRT